MKKIPIFDTFDPPSDNELGSLITWWQSDKEEIHQELDGTVVKKSKN